MHQNVAFPRIISKFSDEGTARARATAKGRGTPPHTSPSYPLDARCSFQLRALICLLVSLQLAVAGDVAGKVLAYYSKGPLFQRSAIRLGLGLGLG